MNVVVLTTEFEGISSYEMLVELLQSKDCVLGVSSKPKEMQLFATTAYYAIRQRLGGTADPENFLNGTFIIDGHYSCFCFLGLNSKTKREHIQDSYEKIIEAWEKEGKPHLFEIEC